MMSSTIVSGRSAIAPSLSKFGWPPSANEQIKDWNLFRSSDVNMSGFGPEASSPDRQQRCLRERVGRLVSIPSSGGR
jgi:hypothetical protein